MYVCMCVWMTHTDTRAHRYTRACTHTHTRSGNKGLVNAALSSAFFISCRFSIPTSTYNNAYCMLQPIIMHIACFNVHIMHIACFSVPTSTYLQARACECACVCLRVACQERASQHFLSQHFRAHAVICIVYTEDLAGEVSLVRIVGGQIEAVLTACWNWGCFFQCQNTAGSFWREIRHGDYVQVLFRHDWAFVWVLANPHLRRGLQSQLLALCMLQPTIMHIACFNKSN